MVPERLLAGEHPGALDEREARDRIRQLHRAGIDFYIDLTEIGERPEYRHLLPHPIEYRRSPIGDTHVPASVLQTQQVLATIREASAQGRRIYVHCRAGIGRTGLIIGCFLAEEEHGGPRPRPAHSHPGYGVRCARSEGDLANVSLKTAEQADYIRHWLKLRARARKL